MSEELTALQCTCIWDQVPPPTGKVPISCRQVYKIKTRSYESIERYKVRLVAQGFTQKHGIDYENTFAPVAKMTYVQVIIVFVVARA